MEEEVYYLKLEALWILTNLAVTDDESAMCLLASDLDQNQLQVFTKPELANDLKFGQSPILDAINKLIIQKLDQGGKDIKTLSLVFDCLANIAPTNAAVARKVMAETCVLDAIRHLLEHN